MRLLLSLVVLSASAQVLPFGANPHAISGGGSVSVRSYTDGPAYAERTNTTITAPSSIQNGDLLMILFIAGDVSDPIVTPPTGFTVASGYPVNLMDAGGFRVSAYVWVKTAASESGNYTITHGAMHSQGFMYAISGGTTLSPAPSTSTGTGSTSTVSGVTTSANGSLVIYFGSDWGDTANLLSPPTGSTPIFTRRTSAANLIFVADGIMTTAGATGNKTQTNNNNATNPWQAGLITVRP